MGQVRCFKVRFWLCHDFNVFHRDCTGKTLLLPPIDQNTSVSVRNVSTPDPAMSPVPANSPSLLKNPFSLLWSYLSRRKVHPIETIPQSASSVFLRRPIHQGREKEQRPLFTVYYKPSKGHSDMASENNIKNLWS